ncbi:hypothetical protein DVH24_004492, partial [Malus domestica]
FHLTIRHKIISFLPLLKEAVRTSALSAHWNSLWSPIEANAQITVAKATKGVERQLHLEFFESLEMAKDLKDGFCGVKHLHLRSVTGLTGTLVSDLFSNWHVLESLKLEKYMGLHNLDVETNSLKNLVVEDCSNMVYITVSANNLKSFWYDMAKDLKGLCLDKNLNRWFLCCEASPSQISY